LGQEGELGWPEILLVQMVSFSGVLHRYLLCIPEVSWLVSLVLDSPLLAPHFHFLVLVVT